jgi:hypothetical protein
MFRPESLRSWLAVVACAVAVGGCDRGGAPTHSYSVLVRVTSLPGTPVVGAAISFGGHVVAHTGDTGRVTLQIHGSEGDRVPLTVGCPEGLRAPDHATDIVLHRLDDPTRKPEYDVQCRPTTRSEVIVVRADRGPHLPVLYLGREIARTDESGAAHALIDVPEGEEVEITVSTSEPGNERLRPQSPSMKFPGSDTSDLHLFNVQFQLEEVRQVAGTARALPVRLN